MMNLFNTRANANVILFTGHFVDVKAMFYMRFGRIPCVCFVGELDVSRAFSHIETIMRNEIVAIYQHSFLDHEKNELFFNNTVFVLRNRRMIELAGNYCQVLHTIRQYAWAHKLTLELGAAFRVAPVVEEKTRVIGFVRSNEMN